MQQEFDFNKQEDGSFEGEDSRIAPVDPTQQEKLEATMEQITNSMESMRKVVEGIQNSDALAQIQEARSLVREVEDIMKNFE